MQFELSTLTEAVAKPVTWRQASMTQAFLGLTLVLILWLVSVGQGSAGHNTMTATSAYTAAQSGEIILLDIRTPEEWQETGIGDGAIGLDMTAENFIQDLVNIRKNNPRTPIALICATGGRSGSLDRYLTKNGFTNTIDVTEGMMGSRKGKGWLRTGLPTYKVTGKATTQRLDTVLP